MGNLFTIASWISKGINALLNANQLFSSYIYYNNIKKMFFERANTRLLLINVFPEITLKPFQ